MKRDYSLDVIRVLAIWMIVNFHFACLMNQTQWGICIFKNGEWGCVGTTMFFMLSGYALHMKYKEVGDLKTFYKKRFLSIFPMFYLVFLLVWIYTAYVSGNIFYGGDVYRLLYTLIGFDGYLTFWGISTYYQGVGEWFTAVIVMIYILYPVMNWVFRKAKWPGTLFLAGLYMWNVFADPFAPLPVDANLITGMAMFWLGMLLEQYGSCLKARINMLPAYVFAGLWLIFVKLPGPTLLWKNLLGILVFVVLYLAFSKVTLKEAIKRPLKYLSSISFAVYLTHHFLLNQLLLRVMPLLVSRKRMAAFYGCYMILVLLCSAGVNWVTDKMIKRMK